MIIVKLMGGLGNQMFQYALGRHLAILNKTELKLDISSFKNDSLREYSLDCLNVQESFATDKEIRRFKKYQRKSGRVWFWYNRLFADKTKYFQERQSHFDPEIFKLKDDVCIDGFWQTEKYFKDIGSIILKDFSFKQLPPDDVNKIVKKIESCEAVSINIRRTDFVNNTFHGTCDVDYYDQAIGIIKKRVNNPIFFVFSDDLNWCKKNILNHHDGILVGHKYAGEKFGLYLKLMSLCKHQIIPNSSFGWWGAWLNQNPNQIVIAPRRWINQPEPTMDRYCNGWTVI